MPATAADPRLPPPGHVYTPAEIAIVRAAAADAAAGQSLLAFMQRLWRRPNEPLRVGPHTRAICERLDRAVEDYHAGRSTYLEIVVPFRHGKSDLSSRYFPAYFLGQDPDAEVMLTGYAADLVQGFSRDVRNIINAENYGFAFPGVKLDPSTNNAGERRILGRTGRLYAIGRGGAATGRGAALLVVDDMCKSREEAESETVRNSAWHGFTNDFLTRLAPVHIVLVVNTRWHVDDLCGRIHDRMDPDSERYEANFPRFERMLFGARRPDGSFLHEARFGRQWYLSQYASLGAYGAAALLDGDPVVRGGAFFKVDNIQWVDEFPAGLAWVRCWDLASTEAEVATDDPDYTVGARVAVGTDSAGVETIYADDWVLMRCEAGKRNAAIQAVARRDKASGVPQYIEAVAGYKDSYTTIRDALAGVAVVHRVTLNGDKVVRAGRIEPHFESGRVAMRRAQPWQTDVLRQLTEFPGGRHDDVVDVLSSGYVAAVARQRQLRGLGSALGKGAR